MTSFDSTVPTYSANRSPVTRRLRHAFISACERIDEGRLSLTTPEGDRFYFGHKGPEAELVLNDWSTVSAIAARGDIGFGEAYVAGLWDSPKVEAVAGVALANLDRLQDSASPKPFQRLKMRAIDTLLRANSKRGASRNIQAHYDVGNAFYQLWLDPSMTYSSALFNGDDSDLERAQARKYDRILQKMQGAERLLEVGCGWGGFAERAAEAGHDLTGITISPGQKGYADARLDGRAEIRLQDYRDTRGKYDGIVSIEMVEAVGERYWPTYFSTLRDRLADGGSALVQAITVPDEEFESYRRRSDYIRHYTFPGGMLLSDKMIRREAARAGLKVQESFAFGQDYARTCRIWRERMDAASPRIEKLGYGAPFLRSWRYYLDICAAAFATGRADVVQVELTHA
ncbi:cyclopropane-fatty-acyl-phospholipid synthase family protein [Rhodalgimonas zhirmunskyi]|uniref:Cyclopropane-fatty-acyl-phospholipid synthase family protein n=1 Tax=Rhodalgimonas zhirmunskyi TaxID=2964767 RepID=A0AAJ1X6G2_9RHOB|nr:cyclopropane-fatty-acyl-phospholipid synthase family protein [Rhodoalgimonas zhirmunskyi]MDQ2095481.1 cyclopropane-fatty-acyl-phospholipid synthase family protein [Rhodoalgimonas zhirmunskyi]